MRRLHLARDLGFWDAVLLGIGFIVGSGVFIMPVLAAKAAGAWSLVAWIAAGIFTILTGLCFAECAIHIPKAGGLYSYAHAALGNFWGFITGYSFWLGYGITIAVEEIALAWYLQFFWPVDFSLRLALAAFVGFVLTWANFKGVKLGGEMEDLFTIGKIAPLVILIIAGAFFFSPASLNFSEFKAVDTLPAIFSALVLVLWAYQGAEIITVPEEEIKNAKKTVPKAIIVAVVSVMALYVLLALVVLGASDWQKYVDSQSPLASIAQALMGPLGGAILAIGGLFSIIGALNAVILASARISFAMARDKLFPKFFSHLHAIHKTPDNALFAHYFLSLALVVFIPDFVKLASMVVLFTLIPWLFSCISTLALQHKKWHEHSILGNRKIIPAIAVISTFALLSYIYIQFALQATVMLAVGIIGYFALKPKKMRN